MFLSVVVGEISHNKEFKNKYIFGIYITDVIEDHQKSLLSPYNNVLIDRLGWNIVVIYNLKTNIFSEFTTSPALKIIRNHFKVKNIKKVDDKNILKVDVKNKYTFYI